MRIGVISEGHSDRAVIINLLVGLTGLDKSDIVPLRPYYKKDTTDKALEDPNTKSSWSVIKEECEERDLIDEFLEQEGNEFVVLQIDTAEAGHYGVDRPNRKDSDYCTKIREAVIQKINEWLKDDISENLLYAISVEEIDAWILTIYEQKDSTKVIDAKKRLQQVLAKLDINSKVDESNYLKLSKPLSKSREISKGKFLSFNCSLEAFYKEVQEKVLPKLL